MQVRIYKPTKSSTQSGEINSNKWWVEFVPLNKNRFIEPFLGRVGSNDMMPSEVHISFDTEELAVKFAKENNYNYEIIPPKVKKIIKKSYASNFK